MSSRPAEPRRASASDALSAQRAATPRVRRPAGAVQQPGSFGVRRPAGPVQRPGSSRVRRQAREVARGIDALLAHQVLSPEMRQVARWLARELEAWPADTGGEAVLDWIQGTARVPAAEPLTKPDENPGRLSGALTDQIRAVQENTHNLVRQLTTAMEHSEPSREQLAGAIKAARELDRGLARLVNDDTSRPGPQAPSPGGPVETFAMEGPAGDRLVARVTPQLFPTTLEVAAPAHGRVHVPVLARFFPAHTVHARKSTAVVVGDHCRLKAEDHYHIHRLSLSLDPLLQPGSPGHAALQKLLKNRTESGFAQFQRTMREIADARERRETQASVPVRDDPHTVVTSSRTLQVGDESRTSVTTHYLADESVLQIVELLARDRGLARSLIAAVDEPSSGSATQRFLRDAARSAGHTDDLVLLDHCAGLRERDTSIYWLFGVDVVSRASTVMVGYGNKSSRETQVHHGDLSRGTILADLATARKQAAQAREAPVMTPRRPNRVPADRAWVRGNTSGAPRRGGSGPRTGRGGAGGGGTGRGDALGGGRL